MTGSPQFGARMESDKLAGILQPGDVLLYRGNGLIGWAIMIKTASTTSHVETYLGNGLSGAARSEGVNTYPLRTKGLKYVLRPNVPFDFQAGLAWHDKEAIGQGYDYLGLLRAFFTPEGRGNIGKMWCSEHAARFAKKSGYFPFGDFDSEKVAPRDFLTSPLYDRIDSDAL